MQAGRVIRMRLSPKDCIRTVDALVRLGIDPATLGGTLSFSHAAKKVFESCLIALERDGVIPARDGFEYSRMMLPFPLDEEAKRKRASQIAFTRLEQHPSYVAEPIVPDTYERRQHRLRYDELIFKQQADPDNFTSEDMQELEPLLEEFQLSERERSEHGQVPHDKL